MSSKQLTFPIGFFDQYGCPNCIFKQNDNCPSGLKGSESLPDNYCDKLTDFFLSLSGPGDSISAVKEKYHLYLQEIQALSDRQDYLLLKQRFDSLRDSDPGSPLLDSMEIQLNSYKLWWARLSESVVKGLGKISDREQRTVASEKPKLTIQQLNVLLKDNTLQLEGGDSSE